MLFVFVCARVCFRVLECVCVLYCMTARSSALYVYCSWTVCSDNIYMFAGIFCFRGHACRPLSLHAFYKGKICGRYVQWVVRAPICIYLTFIACLFACLVSALSFSFPRASAHRCDARAALSSPASLWCSLIQQQLTGPVTACLCAACEHYMYILSLNVRFSNIYIYVCALCCVL